MKSDISMYKQHVQSEAKYMTHLAFEDLKKLGELINGEIALLMGNRSSDLFMILCKALLIRLTEYLNLIYICYSNNPLLAKMPNLIFKNTSRLLHNLERRIDLDLYDCDWILERLDALLDGEIIVQERMHWFRVEDFFEVTEDGEITPESNVSLAKQLIALENHSERIPIYVDEEKCDIKTLALTVLLEIRKRYETVDVITIQKYIGYKDTNISYSFGKAKYLVTWLANHGYIESIKENNDREDLGYGTRRILKTPEEISEILNSD